MTPSPHAEASPADAPRRVSPKPDGIEQSGVKTTITVNGQSFELTDQQLDEAANRVALENTLSRKPRVGGIAADQLRAIVERIERLEEEKAGLASDITDIYTEAKGNGFDCKTVRKIIALRKQDAAERDEADYLLDTYARALGMKPQLDLFEGEA